METESTLIVESDAIKENWLTRKYKSEYCEVIVALMSEGMSITEAAANIGVRRSTIYEWEKHHAEFAAALEAGRDVCQAWWEKYMRTNIGNNEINTALIMINMRNRFHWKSKDPDTPVQISVNADSADIGRIVELAAKARKEVDKIKE